jgi:DNA-binding response OmpR family regulator
MSQPARILIVDDEPMTQDVLQRRLKQNGYDTVSAMNGVDALEMIEHQQFDLVLMDVSMPGLNGIECIQRLRQTWSLDSLPVIVVSAMVDSDDVVAAIEAGANDYIVKPINMRVLMARIAMCLRLRSTVAMLVEAERQRVMVESLGKAARKLAEPMDHVINSLEQEMQAAIEREDQTDRLQEVADWVEHVVDVLETIQKASVNADVPYDQRQRLLG